MSVMRTKKQGTLKQDSLVQESELKLSSNFSYVGGYQIGGPNGLRINLTQKPSFIHRFFNKLILGFVWVDNKQ